MIPALLRERQLPNAPNKISRLWVSKVIRQALVSEKSGKKLVETVLVTNAEIRKINKRFLKHDNATDVISFEYGFKSPVRPGMEHLGEVIVSYERARTISRELGIPYREELARYLVHGTLHLLGYDDHRETDRKKMFKRQEMILKKIFGAKFQGARDVTKN